MQVDTATGTMSRYSKDEKVVMEALYREKGNMVRLLEQFADMQTQHLCGGMNDILNEMVRLRSDAITDPKDIPSRVTAYKQQGDLIRKDLIKILAFEHKKRS